MSLDNMVVIAKLKCSEELNTDGCYRVNIVHAPENLDDPWYFYHGFNKQTEFPTYPLALAYANKLERDNGLTEYGIIHYNKYEKYFWKDIHKLAQVHQVKHLLTQPEVHYDQTYY